MSERTQCSNINNLSSYLSKVSHDEALTMEMVCNIPMTQLEMFSTAYVAGWLEHKTKDCSFTEEEPYIDSPEKDFNVEFSRGGITVPRMCTHDLVKAGLCYIGKMRKKTCCRRKMIDALK